MSDVLHPAEACRTCGAGTRPLGTLRVLGRHDARADQCDRCGFAQLADPSWLAEAYAEAAYGIADAMLRERANHIPDAGKMILKHPHRQLATALDRPPANAGHDRINT